MSSVTAAASARCCLNLIAGSRPRPGTRVAAALAAGSGHVWTLLRSRTPRKAVPTGANDSPGDDSAARASRTCHSDARAYAATSSSSRLLPITRRALHDEASLAACRHAVEECLQPVQLCLTPDERRAGVRRQRLIFNSCRRRSDPECRDRLGRRLDPHGRELASTLEELTTGGVMSTLPTEEFDRETMRILVCWILEEDALDKNLAALNIA